MAELAELEVLQPASDEALSVADNALRRADGELKALVRHPVEMAAIEPKTRKLTLQSRKLWMFLVTYSLETAGIRTEDGYLWRVPVLKLMKDANLNTNNRDMLRESIRACQKTLVEWGSSARDRETGEVRSWSSTQLLGSVEFVRDRSGVACVEWSFPPVLLKQLREHKHYFENDLALALEFSRYSSLALAQVVKRFKSNKGGLTERLPWRKWIPILTGESDEMSEMREKVHSAKKGTSHEKYGEWRYFNRDVIAPAVTEVNLKMTDVIVEAKPIKSGPGSRGRVEALQFKITPRSEFKRLSDDSPRLDEGQKAMVQRLIDVGVKPSMAPQLVTEYPRGQVEAALAELAQARRWRQAHPETPPLDNPAGLLVALLKKGAEGASAAQDKPSPAPTLSPTEAEQASLSDYRSHLVNQARAGWPAMSKEIAEDYEARFAADGLSGAPETVKREHAKKGLKSPMVATRFWSWLARDMAGDAWNPSPAELLAFERNRLAATRDKT